MTTPLLAAVLLAGAGTALLAAGQEKPKPAVAEPFEWSASRRLTWSDYLGRPDPGSQASALTVYVISVEHGCNAGVFSYRVAVMFQPQRSWMKSTGQRLLDHERGHFDLGEVQARRLRRAFASLKEPCELPGDLINEVASKFIIEDAERQQRYDQETVYGLHAGRQSTWDDDIRRQLKDLVAFAQK